MGHVQRVVFTRDVAHTRCRAAFDLVQQAGPRAVVEHRVLAGAQVKHFLQQQNGFLHRPGTGVRAKVTVLLFHRPPVIRHPGKTGHGELQVRVTLVVPKQDVVLRVQRLDQVVFQQQRFRLGAHHRGLHAHNLAHHVADARASVVFLEVAGNPLFEVDGLAHIEHLPLGVEIAVDARQRGQRGYFVQQLFRVSVRHARYCERSPCVICPQAF